VSESVTLHAGGAVTTTSVDACAVHPLAFVTVNVYTPAIGSVTLVDTVGLCAFDVNPLGPAHE
jgi:hypothetical protein